MAIAMVKQHRKQHRKQRLKGSWVVLLSLPLLWGTLPALGNSSISALQAKLQSAVASKNWVQALKVVDQLIPLVPQQASQLKQYRTQLEQLSRSSASPAQRGIQSLAKSSPRGHLSIKRRDHGVPVVDVLFNQRQSFEMLVDSGASLTVITRPMARALGITPANIVSTITVSTANGQTKMPIVYLGSVSVAGLTTRQVPVAIAGPEMEIGLLGQDFLQRYDVNLRSSHIEFHDRR
ncbi:MAG: retroviral-like aspartic protease family protein [Thermosynechococcaceae cyanobacterium MS004]|nr:retroviral-like aspartic protease family protein [Thermosynechococcaceae cyanobacterium MS004]